jgi:alpha-mannosidase
LKRKFLSFSVILLLLSAKQIVSQTVYFADGQHGGIYGHYPLYVTQFLVDQLNQYPDWKINLEIEPETWDVVQTNTPEAYNAFKKLFADQSAKGRIEYVNPQYGQSFLWDIPGECMIRQFDYGMQKVRAHFPNAKFTAYSSEEPMFTSALPGILK